MQIRTASTLAAVLLGTASCVLAQTDIHKISNSELIAQAPDAEHGLVWSETTKTSEIPAAATEIRRRILDKRFSDDDWRALLTKAKVIYTHSNWPANTPYAIGMVYPIWLTDFQGDVRVTPRLPNAKTVSTRQTYGGCALGNDSIREARVYQEVGDLPAGATEVVLDVQFRIGSDSPKAYWAGAMTFPVHVVPTRADAVTPVHDMTIDAILREAIVGQVGSAYSNPPAAYMWLEFHPGRTGMSIDPDIGLHLKVEVLDGDKPIGRLRPIAIEWDASSARLWGDRVSGLSEDQIKDHAFRSRLSVRVTADREGAFRDLKRNKYWDSEVTLPLSESLDRSRVNPSVGKP